MHNGAIDVFLLLDLLLYSYNAEEQQKRILARPLQEDTQFPQEDILYAVPKQKENEEDDFALIQKEGEEESKKGDSIKIHSCRNARIFGGSPAARRATRSAHRWLCKGFRMAMERVGADDQLYKAWFGDYTVGRGRIVKRVLSRSLNMIERRPATYSFNLPSKVAAHCNEIDNKLLAYAKHGSSIIYLCDAYARLADTHCSNKQSKEHELARAWTIASSNTKTRTFMAGPCKTLAKSNTEAAIDNSDNFAFFYCHRQQ